MSDSVAHDQIRAFVERIERLEEERASIAKDIGEVYAEAKGNGFDRKALKIVVTRRRQDHNERMELEALVELYEAALMGRSADEYEEVGTVVATRAPAHATRQIETPMSHASGQPGGDDPETTDDAASAGEDGNTVSETNNGGRHETAVRSEPSVNPGRRHRADSGEAYDVAAAQTGEPAEGSAEETSAPIRRMSMTPLEPREAGGLKGFGFTVRFDEPDAAMRPQTGGIISAPSTVAGPVAVESPATHSEAADLATVTVAETALVPRGAVASEPITHRDAAA